MNPKIILDYPPNIAEIRKAGMEVDGKEPVIFAYGDAIYNPKGIPINQDLLIHESVHLIEQGYSEEGAKQWWKLYLEDSKFRLAEEVKAYVAQYKFVKNNFKASEAKRVLTLIAEALSGPIYGNIIDYYKVETLIRHKAKE